MTNQSPKRTSSQQMRPPQPTQPQNKYWFILGREPLLAAAEIGAVLNLGRGEYGNGNAESDSVLKINADINAQSMINGLGGTVKIGTEIGENLDKGGLIRKITNELKTIKGKINFGISLCDKNKRYSIDDIKNFGLLIKKQLKQTGLSIRYAQNKELALSSATVFHNKLTDRGREFLITNNKKNQNNFDLAMTLAVQPFAQFSQRDFGRPGRDDKSGMLPPKLAMMMINMAQTSKNSVILDPFCGSGTILTEAILLGRTKLIGADISEKAIADTKKNIQWLNNNYKLPAIDYKLYQCDVNKLSAKIEPASIDAIITEPYLGQPLRGHESEMQLLKQTADLKKLYLNSFAQFSKILKKGGVVVFIIPRFKFKDKWVTINILPEIKKFGFEPKPLLPNHEFLTYFRPNQLVGREIWRFTR